MGLIDESPDRWDKFREKITALNKELQKHDAEVKVFFFARHGQGWRKFRTWSPLVGIGEEAHEMLFQTTLQRLNTEQNVGMRACPLFYSVLERTIA